MGDQVETRTTIDIPNLLLTEAASVADQQLDPWIVHRSPSVPGEASSIQSAL